MAARRGERVLTYGLGGSETHWALEDVIAEVEGGTRCAIVCSGLAAVTTPLLAFLNAGDHCLMPDHVYGPTRNFAEGMLKRLGIETTFYHPEIDEAGIAALLRPNTRVVLYRKPRQPYVRGAGRAGDRARGACARRAGARKVLMDNTWGIHHFQPFKHGVDVSIQAATKYPAGHSDILIGAVTVNSDADWQTLFATRAGWASTPARTIVADAARHAHDGRAAGGADGCRDRGRALAVEAAGGRARAAPGAARRARPRICGGAILPGRAACSGWSSGRSFPSESTHAFVEALELFGIGASWGGFESLALPTTGFIARTAGSGKFAGPVVRLHIGLEDVADLIADLEQGLGVMRGFGKCTKPRND